MRKSAYASAHLPSALGILGPGNDGKMSDVTDGGQRFAAEAEGADRLQIFELVQLGRGEALADDRQIFFTDSASVVADLQQLETPGLHLNRDGGRTFFDK